MRNVRPVLIKTGRVFKLDKFDMIRSILMPAALPEIFTGLRIGFSLTLIGTLLGEMFASQRGLGFLLMNAIGLHNTDLLMAITTLLVAFAATVSIVLLHIDRRLRALVNQIGGRWRRSGQLRLLGPAASRVDCRRYRDRVCLAFRGRQPLKGLRECRPATRGLRLT